MRSAEAGTESRGENHDLLGHCELLACAVRRTIPESLPIVPAPTGAIARVEREHHTTARLRARLAGCRCSTPRATGGQGARRRGGAAVRRTPAAGGRPGRRGVRAPPDLRADDPGDQHRRRAGDHHRAAEHAPLREALDRDPGDRPDARPQGEGAQHRRRGRRLRRRDGAGPHPRLGALPGRADRGRQGLPAPAQTHVVEWDDVEGLHERQAQPGRRAPDRRRSPTCARPTPPT